MLNLVVLFRANFETHRKSGLAIHKNSGGRTLDPSVGPEEMVQKMSKEELKQCLGGASKWRDPKILGSPKFIND